MWVNQWLESTRQGAAQEAGSGALTRPQGHCRLHPAAAKSCSLSKLLVEKRPKDSSPTPQPTTVHVFQDRSQPWQSARLCFAALSVCRDIKIQHRVSTTNSRTIRNNGDWVGGQQSPGWWAQKYLIFSPCSWPGFKLTRSGEESWRGSRKSSARKGAHHGGRDWLTTASICP